jgi:Ser/Thr protein kinase RdoA (MazF antagonist)
MCASTRATLVSSKLAPTFVSQMVPLPVAPVQVLIAAQQFWAWIRRRWHHAAAILLLEETTAWQLATKDSGEGLKQLRSHATPMRNGLVN